MRIAPQNSQTSEAFCLREFSLHNFFQTNQKTVTTYGVTAFVTYPKEPTNQDFILLKLQIFAAAGGRYRRKKRVPQQDEISRRKCGEIEPLLQTLKPQNRGITQKNEGQKAFGF